MILIKRYPNRKLYNTETKEYISLEGIACLVHDGIDIQVVDYSSGDDLTALILTQIVLRHEKNRRGLLSNTLLTNLIRTGEDRLSSFQRNFLFEDHLQNYLEKFCIPTQADIRKINQQLDELATRVDQILNDGK
jgi:polyhydroxyalkanoate synthesis repressor PhaR